MSQSPIIMLKNDPSKWQVSSDNEEQQQCSSAVVSKTPVVKKESNKLFNYCIMCNRKFVKWKDLFNHLTTHECGINIFACFKCSVGFMSFNALLEHERQRHPTSKYITGCRPMLDTVAHAIVCSKCGIHTTVIENPFGTVRLNYESLRSHRSGKFRKLSLYTWTKSSKEYLGKCASPKAVHIRIKFMPNLVSIPLKCEYCDFVYKEWSQVEQHAAENHREKCMPPKTCIVCKNTFFSTFFYQTHVQQMHMSEKWFLMEFLSTFPNSSPFEPAVNKPNDRLLCDLCATSFPLADFNKHDCAVNYTRRVETDGYIIKCPSVILNDISINMNKDDMPLTSSLGKQFKKYAMLTLKYDSHLAVETVNEMKLKEYMSCRCCEIVSESVVKLCRHFAICHNIFNLDKLTKQQILETYCDLVPVSVNGMLCPKGDCKAVFCSATAVEWHLKLVHFSEFILPLTIERLMHTDSFLSTRTPIPDDPLQRIAASRKEIQNGKQQDTDCSNSTWNTRPSFSLTKKLNNKPASDSRKSRDNVAVAPRKVAPANNEQPGILLIHPPPVANMKPGIYTFIVNNNGLVPSGTFMNGEPGGENYCVVGDQVSQFTKYRVKTKFCIGCIPDNYMLPENLANKINLPVVRAPQWECPICSLKSGHVDVLRTHLKEHHSFLCSNCMQCYVTEQYRRDHEKQCPPEALVDQASPPVCIKCGGLYSTWKEYFVHLFDVHQDDIRFDEITGRIFPLLDVEELTISSTETINAISCGGGRDRDVAVINQHKIGEKRKIDELSSFTSGDCSSVSKRLALDINEEFDDVSAVQNKNPSYNNATEGATVSASINKETTDLAETTSAGAVSSYIATMNVEEKNPEICDTVVCSSSTVTFPYADTPLDIAEGDDDKPNESQNSQCSLAVVSCSENSESLSKVSENVIAAKSPSTNDVENNPPAVETSAIKNFPGAIKTVEECHNNNNDDDDDDEVMIETIREVKREKSKSPPPSSSIIDDEIEIISDDGLAGPSTSADRKTHNCTMCSKTFQTLRALTDHTNLEHVYDAGATTDLILPVPTNLDFYVCRLCCLAYENRTTFDKHIKKHGTVIACSKCTAVSLAMDYLQSHLNAHDISKLIFGCALCHAAFRNERNLLLHMNKEHQIGLLWTCQQCSKANTDWSKMFAHFTAEHPEYRLGPNHNIISLILPCAQSKLHYQPEKPDLYQSMLNTIVNGNVVVVGECTHRTFLAYSETLIGCPKCGSMIPATKYLLENEEIRKNGQLKLFLVDEDAEKIVESLHPFVVQSTMQQRSRSGYVNGGAMPPDASSAPIIRSMLNRPMVFGSRIRPTPRSTSFPILTTNTVSIARPPNAPPAMGASIALSSSSSSPSSSSSLLPTTDGYSIARPVVRMSSPNVTPSTLQPVQQASSPAPAPAPTKGFNYCSICRVSYGSLAALKVHMMKHDTVSVIFCLECGFSSKTSSIFYHHINDVHASKLRNTIIGVCQHCGERMLGLDVYLQHEHPNTYRCNVCFLPGYSFDDPDTHALKHSLYGQFCCPFCTTCFFSRRDMDVHKLRHCCEIWVMCRDCGMCYKNLDQMEKHFTVTHWTHVGQINATECHACREPMNKTPLFHLLVRHTVLAVRLKQSTELTVVRPQLLDASIVDHTKYREVFVCQFCRWISTSAVVARQHASTNHASPGNFWTLFVSKFDTTNYNSQMMATARCTYCSTRSTLKQMITEHLHLIHPELGRFLCEMCDEDFDTKSDRFYHNQFNHRSNKASMSSMPNNAAITNGGALSPLFCPLCGMNLPDENFMKHLSTHVISIGSSGCAIMKMCTICGICFLNRSEASIATHMESHGRIVDNSPHELALIERRLVFAFRCVDGPVNAVDAPVCDVCDEILCWDASTMVKHFLQHCEMFKNHILICHERHCIRCSTNGVNSCRMCSYLRDTPMALVTNG